MGSAKPVKNKHSQKERLDKLIVQHGFCSSRTRAANWVRDGVVFVDGEIIQDPAKKIAPKSQLKINHSEPQWVSRGAFKLLGALEALHVDVSNKTCLDLGASTGGFTEVLLKHKAAKVYAVDVGQDQLVDQLRHDPRVVCMEGQNARYVSADIIPEPIDLLVSDVSFISLKIALPAAIKLLSPVGQLIALIKPQFEVGKGNLGKNGVVKDPDLHQLVCEDISSFLTDEGLEVQTILDSPVLGPKGNKEFLIHATQKA